LTRHGRNLIAVAYRDIVERPRAVGWSALGRHEVPPPEL